MNFEIIKCQVSFFYGRLTFFLGFFGPTPMLPTVKVLVFISVFVQDYQRWKFWFLLAFLSKSPTVKVLVILATVSFTGHFDYEYQWWKLCDLEFAFEQPLASRSATRELAFTGVNLWEPAVETGAVFSDQMSLGTLAKFYKNPRARLNLSIRRI